MQICVTIYRNVIRPGCVRFSYLDRRTIKLDGSISALDHHCNAFHLILNRATLPSDGFWNMTILSNPPSIWPILQREHQPCKTVDETKIAKIQAE